MRSGQGRGKQVLPGRDIAVRENRKEVVMPAMLAIRTNPANLNHHLWLNNGTWFVHYTLHLPDFTARKVRRSLGTKCVAVARRKRDAILSETVVRGDQA